jgi:hypothetical protein
MTITERLNNEYKRLYTLFHVENGKGFYIEDGKFYTREEFEDKYPVPLVARPQEKDNSDPTKKWMYH